MSLKDSMRNFFGVDEENETQLNRVEADLEEYHSQDIEDNSKNQSGIPVSQKSKKNVIPMGQRSTVPKTSIHIIEPRVYSESQKIADLLINNEAVLLNFKRVEMDQAVKIIDYVMGCIYALQGDIQEVGEGIFLCTPASVEITGLIKEDFDNFYQ